MKIRGGVHGRNRDRRKARHREASQEAWRRNCQCCPDYHPIDDLPRRTRKQRAIAEFA